MFLAIYAIATLIIVPAIVFVYARRSFRRMDQAVDRQIWVWAEAYLRLRDECDSEGDMPQERHS